MPGEPRKLGEQPPEDKDTQDSESQGTLAQRIKDLEDALAASRAAAPLNQLPVNGAGPGDKISQTWSLYDQEQANAELARKAREKSK